ncbi:hypothetical protein D9613_011708 [Agrocybe pediades]|uniref:SNF5-domain-containing protein n=1 Tax=Agrocybe pediades TaxID=84607 RepID=A0A8H4VJ31_9AGAR|nr:hypothetical protein D9613_011708 [Agrocybe pediades]
MDSPYRGAKRKLTGEMVPPRNMGMNTSIGGGIGSGSNNMAIPSSPRLGGAPGALGLSGVSGNNIAGGSGMMGPPVLPRSMSGDGMGLGLGMNNVGMGMGGGNMNMNMGNMNGMGGLGGGRMGNMGGNMGGMGGNISMNGVGGLSMGIPNNVGMMNGAQRQSPRPPSAMSMGMGLDMDGTLNGLPGGMNGMSNMGMNLDLSSRQGMGMNMMGVGPSGSQNLNMAGPHTPVRQGSLAPTQSTATPQGIHAQLPNNQRGMMRPGSIPPSPASGVIVGGGMPIGAGGRGAGVTPTNGGSNGMVGVAGNMTMGITPSSPLQPGAGPQSMTMTPSIGANSISGANAINGLSVNGGGPMHSSLSTSSTPSSSTVLPAGAVTPSASSAGNNNANVNNGSAHPPLPPTLNPQTTEVTLVPLLTSLETIPSLRNDEIAQVKSWMETDRAYDGLLGEMKVRMQNEAREAFSVGGIAGPQWWERGALGNGQGGNWNRWRKPREPFELKYPRQRRDGMMGRSGRKTLRREGLKLPRRISPEQANRPEQLVPIRIEFDVEHHRMRDTFVWNLNDPVVTPEAFAQSLVEDYNLAPSFHNIIVKSIQDQLSDFRNHSGLYDDGSHNYNKAIIRGAIDNDDAKWWEAWRRRVEKTRQVAEDGALSSDEEAGGAMRKKSTRRKAKKAKATERDMADTDVSSVKRELDEDGDALLADNERDAEDEKGMYLSEEEEEEEDAFKPLAVEEIPVDENAMHEDMRILIKLDIIVASIKLEDQFEWDLDNPTASPEDFAEVYTQELGLGGEFKTAIAHSIREQVQTYQKSLFLVGHPSDGSAIQDEELKQSFLPSLTSAARPVSEVNMFTPVLNYLSDGELERTEKERDKDLNKRRKRNTRGRRGVALPDREPIRTYRTPAIGFPELDAATLALAAAANAPMSRRAAAAAASLTIANMVASENGTAFMPQTLPSAPQPAPVAATSKEKKPKGLFKAPSFPASVLRPRAHVAAPTPSTAADSSSSGPMLADGDALGTSSSSLSMMGGDSRSHNSKMMTAKKQKELEREAKEKEFVDGQHSNYIDGVWHCSNCGCPENIAIGRRKGPLGDKSQCGTCGKYWHRHRRPRPVEYNADPAFHTTLKLKEQEAASIKTPASRNKKGGAAAALRAQSAANSAATPDISEPQSPTVDVEMDLSRRSLTPLGGDDDRAVSPVSTSSSASEPPLAQRVKTMNNGSSSAHSKQHDQHHRLSRQENHSKHPGTKEAKPSSSTVAKSVTPAIASGSGEAAPPSGSAAPTSPSRARPPQWLSTALQVMQGRYPHDRFEVILRRATASSTPEWRIKCLDCPGKLYTPGPGETLSNYDVHLKNRLHRQRVNDRLAASASGVDAVPEASSSAPPVSSTHSRESSNSKEPTAKVKDSQEKKDKNLTNGSTDDPNSS